MSNYYLEMDGVIDLVGESQLIQDEGSIISTETEGVGQYMIYRS